jgi:hypothetical protein
MGGTGEGETYPTKAPVLIHLPVRSTDAVRSMVPYDDSRFLDGVVFVGSRKFKNVILGIYTDIFGRTAVQPTAGERKHIVEYLDPLANEGPSDPILREFRVWSCWAQGFECLEPEIRWYLTFVFDLCNIGIMQQMKAYERGEGRLALDLLWNSRYHLHGLMCIVEDLCIHFKLDHFQIPDIEWL